MKRAVQGQIAGTVRRILAGDEPPRIATWNEDDPNPIPEDSPVRIVHADPAVFVGGVRALLFQTLHPDAMYAVAEHSDYNHDPLGRLQRTGHFLGDTIFGSATQANDALHLVRRIHSRVTGVLPDGRLYRADDPHLLGWVHVTEVDSFLASHQRYGKVRLTKDQADRYVADMAIIGEALGVDDAPLSQAELAAMIDSYRDELHPSRECRDATRFLFAPPLPLGVLPFYGLIFSSAVALLPRWVRAMLLLPVAPGIDPLVLRPAMTAMTRVLRWAREAEYDTPAVVDLETEAG